MAPCRMFWAEGQSPGWLDAAAAAAARAHRRGGCLPLKTAGTAASGGLDGSGVEPDGKMLSRRRRVLDGRDASKPTRTGYIQ